MRLARDMPANQGDAAHASVPEGSATEITRREDA